MRMNFPKNIAGLILLSIIAGLIFTGSIFRTLDHYELDMLDFRFRIRPVIPTSEEVVIIEIGDDTVRQLGRFPFDRSYHAGLIKALAQAGAKAVVFDIFFSEIHSADFELEQAMGTAGNVYLPFVFELNYRAKLTTPTANAYTANSLESFRESAKGTGHINVIADSDGKFRRVPLFIQYQDKMFPYLAFLVSCDFLGIRQQDVKILPGRYLKCGAHTTIPLDEESNIIVNYTGRWGQTYKHYSYLDVLRSYIAQLSGEQQAIDLSVFKDKVCLVGLSAAGTTDLHPSPFEPLYPSVGILADIFNSIIKERFIGRAGRPVNLLILLTIMLVTTWSFFRTKPLKGLYALLGIATSFVLLGVFLFVVWGLWIDMFYPVLTMVFIYTFCLLCKYAREWKKRLLVENELQIAQRIQESFLPKALPKTDCLDIAASLYMARQVGGDLYDFCEFSPKKVGVMVGDVSGKGIPASLFMSMVSGAFKFFALSDVPCAETLHNLNLKLIQDSNAHLFVTMFYAIFDLDKSMMLYANAGHLPVLYAPGNSSPQFLDVEEGYPLGCLESAYSSNQINFSSEDIFVFYTDGLTEAMNIKSEMYEKERLLSVVEKNRGCSARDLLNAIERDVRRFEPKQRQHDDITLVVIKII